MTTLTTFHPFSNLPGEIRVKIWSTALEEPRTVYVSCQKGMLDRDRRFAEAFKSSTPPPLLLHICRESRFEALALYTPHFKTATSERYSYINFNADMLRCPDSVLEYLGNEEARRVERMILEVADTQYFGHFNMDHLVKMPRLRDLVLETGNTFVPSWDNPQRYLDTLTNDFERARYEDPGWVCPTVRIMKKETKELLKTIDGGALLEGWRAGDKHPIYDAEEH